MKHVKLFENFSNGNIFIGWINHQGLNGGIAILTEEELTKNGFQVQKGFEKLRNVWSKGYAEFSIAHRVNKVPPAIAYIGETYGLSGKFDPNGIQLLTDAEKMRLEKAKMENPGIDFDNQMTDPGIFAQIFGEDAVEPIYGFISNPQLNTIYWSEQGEVTHGYFSDWGPISLSDIGKMGLTYGDEDPYEDWDKDPITGAMKKR